MNTAIATPCRGCGEPLTELKGGITICIYHDGVQDGELEQPPKPHVRVEQDKAYDLYIAEKWRAETGTPYIIKGMSK